MGRKQLRYEQSINRLLLNIGNMDFRKTWGVRVVSEA